MTLRLDPFLKWAGGKRWLVDSSQLRIPTSYGKYIEPFLGSGALYFRLAPGKALLSDLNSALIETYRAVRDQPNKILALLEEHQQAHSSDYYYAIRIASPSGSVERAARFIYLNRTCWNGLYRVNREGKFNVPIGTKTKVAFETSHLLAIANLLASADIGSGDFEQHVDNATEGDLVFLDPPYTANHNMNGFLKYNEKIFSWSDQVRLRDAAVRAANRGAYVIVTNADHHSVRELYAEPFKFEEVGRASVLAGKAVARRRTTEALFTANF